MKPRFNILVVDDDLKNIQVGINFLKKTENYHLVFATSGEQALERVKENDFDLILLDIIMPTMDGFTVCRRLKDNEKTRNIPVIFLTAKHGDESLMKGFEIGGADYITKPFNAAELNARVKTHLELHYHYKKEISKLHQLLAFSQKAETIKFISSAVVHDCSNFLGAIPYSLQKLEGFMTENPDSDDKNMNRIKNSRAALSKAIDLLIQFSNFANAEEEVYETVDMNDVISDLGKVFRDWERYDIVCEMKVLRTPSFAFADKLHVEQVILNMLINAQHAVIEQLNQTGKQGEISLVVDQVSGVSKKDLDDTKEYLKVSVSDNGIGVPENIREKIFDPYFTTKAKEGGSGLGLAVSKHIIARHNGLIDVDSTVGEGATFNIYLPKADS